MASKKTFDINRKPLEEPDELSDVLEEIHTSPRGKKHAGDTLITVGIVIVAFISAIAISNAYTARVQSSKSTLVKANTVPAQPEESTKKQKKTPVKTPSTTPDPFAPLTLNDVQEVSTPPQATTSTIPEKNSFTIKILNGNGVTGDAAKLKKELSDKGFTVGDTGNAKLKYTKTQVYYKADKKAQADLVVQNLTGRTIEQSEADAGLIGATNDVLIVIGKT
ncbi:hypothetical protein AUK41_00750 [Candidatus Berkelbacteria bacterium CG2_30_43_20]|nr:MAG: hypothetical protein AUK41_00750 [Candidatus Berkelbacteria bacterium CG2_30_43_20]